jgi:exopolyphosphatase/pppGpp-phosphohydrolase
MGRFTDEDARVRSVRAMEKRYHVDALQADRVEATVTALLAQVESEWGLEDPLAELMLRWAARLHETGLDIAHSKYHRHSAYLLEHADMPGFPREEQLLLAALVGGIAGSSPSMRSRICCRPGTVSRSSSSCSCASRCCCIGDAAPSRCPRPFGSP